MQLPINVEVFSAFYTAISIKVVMKVHATNHKAVVGIFIFTVSTLQLARGKSEKKVCHIRP